MLRGYKGKIEKGTMNRAPTRLVDVESRIRHRPRRAHGVAKHVPKWTAQGVGSLQGGVVDGGIERY
jgi:hypothetical protein